MYQFRFCFLKITKCNILSDYNNKTVKSDGNVELRLKTLIGNRFNQQRIGNWKQMFCRMRITNRIFHPSFLYSIIIVYAQNIGTEYLANIRCLHYCNIDQYWLLYPVYKTIKSLPSRSASDMEILVATWSGWGALQDQVPAVGF